MSTLAGAPAAVTVIVPGFDVEPYVDDALDSLRAQTRTDWNAILVDDASTDATGIRFDAAAAADPRFRVVHQDRRRGLGAARNAGLELVQTPYLGFLDADDVLTPGALDRLIGSLESSGSDFALGAYVRLRPDATGAYRPGVIQPWVAAATAPARRSTTIDEHPAASGNIVAWSKVSRTGFWRRNGLRFPEGRLYEDQIVAQQMYARANAFDTVPDVLVHWRERADGSSITQHKAALPVLHDYLAAMAGGIDVLDSAGHPAAAAERVRLILAMDLPPLVEIAREHADPGYAAALGAFVRDLISRPDAAGLTLPAGATEAARW
ncbi:glycosyltransferase family 2 protein [Microbacterium pygmaeum]|uniref:Glycosyl transferase family 2 n=1 Tax=Microbacterium pygmaeum TaxID=370764 RepID=A0A1G7ZB69_9MICO|nr:glycosyltransferase family 2 protein [Microbacterium pygmaeum]SDH05869.1 Glycosyl transferase family 2 [Microbacterium pygmaeum]